MFEFLTPILMIWTQKIILCLKKFVLQIIFSFPVSKCFFIVTGSKTKATETSTSTKCCHMSLLLLYCFTILSPHVIKLLCWTVLKMASFYWFKHLLWWYQCCKSYGYISTHIYYLWWWCTSILVAGLSQKLYCLLALFSTGYWHVY